MEFLSERKGNSMLFPHPGDGERVGTTPPGLSWLPAEGASGYRVEIRDGGGSPAYEKDVGSDPVHLPDRALEPGTYTWDVVALDAEGNGAARRGEQAFTVADGIPELPWIEPAELLARVPPEHSRLIYLKRDLPAIRSTLETTRKRSWRACLEAAERALDKPAPTFPTYHKTEDATQSRLEYKAYFADFRSYIDRALMDLALAFLMTEEAKYAEAAKRILMEVTGWPTDDEDVTSVSAKWGDEPGLSFSRCAHRAYDWLYDVLNEAERARVLKMCEERAWQTYRREVNRHNYLTYPGESHAGRLIAYLSEMAVVMARESEGAKTWLEYSLKSLTTFFPHWGGYEGGWAQGIGYGLAYNLIHTPALEGLRRACDFDLWKRPVYGDVRYFFFYCTAIRGEIKPFGDGAEGGGPGTEAGGRFAAFQWFHAQRAGDPYMGWWANQIEGWSGAAIGELSLVFEDEQPSKAPADLPNSRAFRGVGWAALHSDLTAPDEDTFFLFKASPFGSVSHSHADQNTFAIMKGGKALAIASGYYGPAYGQPHHTEWTRQTKANNGILVNGEGQPINDATATGHLSAFEDRKGLTYVCGDATAAYGGKLLRFNRHVLFLRPGLFLMLDDLEAPGAARFQWLLHAFEEMGIDGGTGRVVSKRDGTTLDVRLHSPAGLALSQTDQFDTPYNARIPEMFHRDLPNHWHVTAETAEEVEAARIGATMGVWGAQERFELEALELEGWFGARAIGDSGTVEGWVQVRVGAGGPEGYGDAVAEGRAMLCGTGADGDRFVA